LLQVANLFRIFILSIVAQVADFSRYVIRVQLLGTLCLVIAEAEEEEVSLGTSIDTI
jgi:hypothetical protein